MLIDLDTVVPAQSSSTIAPRRILAALLALAALFGCSIPTARAAADPIRVLFLGDRGHHNPQDRFLQIRPVLESRGIALTYTEDINDLNAKTLDKYDGILIYANITALAPEKESALLDAVSRGKALIAVHCASYCFLNSPKYIALVGAQFEKHGTGVFRTKVAAHDHPITNGYHGFECWDETYVHTKHNPEGRTVLEVRPDPADGETKESGKGEPYTWVKTHGQGRVFYTAWGHDDRTWSHPGFHNLLERGIRWSTRQSLDKIPVYQDVPKIVLPPKADNVFEFQPANVPFYPAGEKWGTLGDTLKRMQKPMSPAASQARLAHPDDLKPSLFISEPLLPGKPLCMNWDAKGRLWVSITLDYPNELQPAGKGRDRIVICEDTDGDGVADKVKTFADNLSIPTSLTFVRDGVVIHQAPHTLWLRDRNGDDVADERTVLFTGWGTQDTHAGPSNLRYGLDNYLYSIVGYSGFEGTIGGVRQSFRQGLFRFTPDGKTVEFLRSTNNNSWGVGISEEGLLFGSTANGCSNVFMPIANRYYESVRGWSSQVLPNIAFSNQFHPITEKVRQVDWHGGFTAAAGHALYTARAYPPVYWNRTAFVNEPTGHLTATFALQESGSNFFARYAWNLVAGDDEWNAPTVAEVGPDGAVWVIDWYNFIVQHNPTPSGFQTGKGNAYETDLRDKRHGRIYRMLPRDPGRLAGPNQYPNLDPQKPESLVAALKNTNMFWRLHAQRLLVERGLKDVTPALLALVRDPATDATGLNPSAIHALWTLHGLGVIGIGDGKNKIADKDDLTATVLAAFRHPSAGVRRNALLTAPRTEATTQALLAGGVLNDPSFQVRLSALLTLAELPPSAEAASAVLTVLDQPENLADRWLPDAATAAAARHDTFFLKLLCERKTALPPKIANIARQVAEHYARGGPVATVGGVLAHLQTQAVPRETAELLIDGIAKGWRRDQRAQLTDNEEAAIATLLGRLSPSGQGGLLRLANNWGSAKISAQGESVIKELIAVIKSENTNTKTNTNTDAARLSAARQLVEFRPDDAVVLAEILDLVTPRTPPAVASGFLEAAAAAKPTTIAPLLLKRVSGMTPANRQATLTALLRRPETTSALLDAIAKGDVQLSELGLDQRQALSNHPNRRIKERAAALFAQGGALPSPDRLKVLDELAPKIVAGVGNVTAGKAMFTKHCTVCHLHGDLGNRVGPELTGMAVHPKDELLVHILDPNRSVEGNYRVYTVQTSDGRVLNGLLASETRTSVELIDSQGKKAALLREDIEELRASTQSLMPEGFEKQMTVAELTDLLAFLTNKGKYVPVLLNKVATSITDKGMFFEPDGRAERLIFPDWKPKTFAGVPFVLVDPQNGTRPNAVLLYGPHGNQPPRMPKSVTLPCNTNAVAIHFLSGVSGWGYPIGDVGSVSLNVKLHYVDGKTENHPLKNGIHFADYIRRVDVPESQFAFPLRGQQIRYLSIRPKRDAVINRIELEKGPDDSAPVIMAVTIETKSAE